MKRPPLPCFAAWAVAYAAASTALAVDLQEVSSNWGNTSLVPIRGIMLTLGLVLIAIGSVAFVRWWKVRDQHSRPISVYHRLASDLGLSWRDQLLLWRIARAQSLPSPITLMLCPTTLWHHAGAFLKRRSATRRQQEMQRIAEIRYRLFGDEAAPQSESQPA